MDIQTQSARRAHQGEGESAREQQQHKTKTQHGNVVGESRGISKSRNTRQVRQSWQNDSVGRGGTDYRYRVRFLFYLELNEIIRCPSFLLKVAVCARKRWRCGCGGEGKGDGKSASTPESRVLDELT